MFSYYSQWLRRAAESSQVDAGSSSTSQKHRENPRRSEGPEKIRRTGRVRRVRRIRKTELNFSVIKKSSSLFGDRNSIADFCRSKNHRPFLWCSGNRHRFCDARGWEVAVHFLVVEKLIAVFSAVFFGCRFSKRSSFLVPKISCRDFEHFLEGQLRSDGSKDVIPPTRRRNVSRETKAERRSRPQGGARPRSGRVKRERVEEFFSCSRHILSD